MKDPMEHPVEVQSDWNCGCHKQIAITGEIFWTGWFHGGIFGLCVKSEISEQRVLFKVNIEA